MNPDLSIKKIVGLQSMVSHEPHRPPMAVRSNSDDWSDRRTNVEGISIDKQFSEELQLSGTVLAKRSNDLGGATTTRTTEGEISL